MMRERASMTKTGRASDGLMSTAIESAKLVCGDAGCPESTSTVCPAVACSVHLVSVQAEEDAALRERLNREQVERLADRAARRAARTSRAMQEPPA